MPFLRYDVASTGATKKYTRVGEIQIAGKNGPLAAIQHTQNREGTVPLRWHATAADILRSIGGDEAAQAILIDLKPKADTVSLYRLHDVWGFSYSGWTPLAPRLEVLFADFEHKHPAQLKAAFTDEDADGGIVGEFLYVRGGVVEGSWNWGMVGRVNGALLWRDAFEYLTGELQKVL
jgi:hypothetical protein